MNKFIILIFFLSFSVLFAQGKTSNIELLIEEKIKTFPTETEFALAVNTGDKTVFYGYKNENSFAKKVLNQNSLFEIGSVTKIFTASLLAQEIEKGNIAANDKLSTSLKDISPEISEITYKQLVTHSSGLPRLSAEMFAITDFSNPYKNYDLKAMERDLLKNQVRSEWIGKYDYSNFGTSVLGYALAKINGSSFEDLIVQRIFKPLKMKNSFVGRSHIEGKIVVGLDAEGRPTPNWDMNAANPAGGIISSASDMAKFAEFQLKSNEKWVKQMQKPLLDINEKLAIGLGWHILKSENILWHNGGTGGYTSFIAIDPANSRAVVLLTNVSAMHPKSNDLDKLAITILKN